MKRALLLAIAIALMSSIPAFAQCGISQSQGFQPVVGSGNIQGCSVGQRINVRTNSQALASALPPLDLRLPAPAAPAPAAPAAAPAQAPAPSDVEQPAAAPQESRRINPNLIDDRSLMAFSAPGRGRNAAPASLEYIVQAHSPQQVALTKVFSKR